MTADTPRTTVLGNTFIAPAGWSITVRGAATILAPPEEGSRIALVDVRAADADAAVAAAWAAYDPAAKWPLKVTTELPAKDGWTDIRNYEYQVSPNLRRDVRARVLHANGAWTVGIYDMARAVGEKRLGQVVLIVGRLLPRGYARESFAGKTAHDLDAARIAELGKYIEEGQKELGVPGVAVGIVQHGKVVFAGGFGVRELGKPAKADGKTLFMIASNTKAMTTLLLAKLVDDKKLTWDTPVTSLLASFKLGDEATTKSVLVKHLICACTGLPRQDFEWLFQFEGVKPDGVLANLGTMQPTSKFGEMFQYSNPLAAAAGFVAGHVVYPKLELGAAYDRAMQRMVFGPLGMKSTTFDYARALRGNSARPHGPTIDGKPAVAAMDLNYSAIPVRPAGAA
ncbi:MAG TPA: serine hydrolase domain-containing protein, partial [Kofleriaceae bacterium]|nr:serine hydrolase domain-containing protein [Kofleriaceae bacterium]